MSAAASASSEIRIATARGELSALRGGDANGPKLLALHGWLDNAASFEPLRPWLAKFDLVALDLPGHGASAHRAPGYDYVLVDWIHDVLDAMDSLGWQRANLLGHSMGGAMASLVATSAPERVQRLALIEALGPISGEPAEAGVRLRNAVAARRAMSPERAPRVIANLETAVAARLAATPMPHDAAQSIVERNLARVEGGFSWRSDPRLTLPSHIRTGEETIRAWLAQIESPTLVITADPSPPYFTPQARDARLAVLRDGTSRVFAGGHHLHMEQPDVIGPLLRDFLSGSDVR